MNTTARFLSIAAVAAFASFGAHADEADASQFATKFDTQRTRVEVMADAASVAALAAAGGSPFVPGGLADTPALARLVLHRVLG